MIQKEELATNDQSYREISDRQIYPLQIRMSKEQKKQMDQLAKMSGYRTLSQFARSKIFSDTLALERKMNKILEMLGQLMGEKQCAMKIH